MHGLNADGHRRGPSRLGAPNGKALPLRDRDMQAMSPAVEPEHEHSPEAEKDGLKQVQAHDVSLKAFYTYRRLVVEKCSVSFM
jgi:hypothetical protein